MINMDSCVYKKIFALFSSIYPCYPVSTIHLVRYYTKLSPKNQAFSKKISMTSLVLSSALRV